MIDLRRILVGTDFGETSTAALQYGVGLAQRFGAELYLFHAIDHQSDAVDAEYPVGLLETMHNAAHDRLRRLISADELRDIEPHCVVRVGPAADEIVRYANDCGADLIVLRALMGSVAEKVVRRASCPVLTIHHPELELAMASDSVQVPMYAMA